MIDVSIILVNYNTFELTCTCIESIGRGTKECTYEIILVDNGSEDRPPEDFETLFPEIILVRSETNLGFAKGNNLGLQVAKGRTILLLNTDTEIRKDNDAISICLEALENLPEAGVIGARLEYPDGSFQSSCQRFPDVKYKLLELMRVQKFLSKERGGRLMLGAFFNHEILVEADWVWGTFFMFRKDMLDDLSGKKLNDDYFMYAEDIQWCMDFRRNGWKVYFNPAAHVIHHMGGSQGGQQLKALESYELFLRKNYSGLQRFFIQILDRLLIR